jgi:hypothetical protein
VRNKKASLGRGDLLVHEALLSTCLLRAREAISPSVLCLGRMGGGREASHGGAWQSAGEKKEQEGEALRDQMALPTREMGTRTARKTSHPRRLELILRGTIGLHEL